jgi:predicted TIM-barrel fold metal-dependent hydrolase
VTATNLRARLAGAGGVIDVHGHYLPPAYRAALERGGHRYLDGNHVEPPPWSTADHLAAADELGIATTMLSISSPGLLVSDDARDAVGLARRINEQGADLVRDHPRRFGLFASLPLPDVDAALTELTRAYDDLGVDGVSLLTNYAGQYLGDARLEPLFAELSRRRAVVALHPTSPAGWELVSFGRSRGTVEFMFDTARAVFNLILSGTLDRHPGVTLIVPHGGGVIPLLAERVDRSREFGEPSRVDVFAALAGLLYDLAGGVVPRQLPALLSIAAPTQLVFGSDFPFSPLSFVASAANAVASAPLLSESDLSGVFRLTALGTFARLRDG